MDSLIQLLTSSQPSLYLIPLFRSAQIIDSNVTDNTFNCLYFPSQPAYLFYPDQTEFTPVSARPADEFPLLELKLACPLPNLRQGSRGWGKDVVVEESGPVDVSEGCGCGWIW